MATVAETYAPAAVAEEKHPRGLYVLFATEMWERFSFYTMLAMLVLYMRDAVDGFGWSVAKSTGIYSYYQAFVYFTPLLGGFLADRFLGYRRSITIGGLFFMAGHLLLAVPKNIPIFFTALVCLIIGNGFFKPNVSSMVGNLYREGSHLKDRAYLIFYMGINIGAALAPIVAELVQGKFGFHPAFAVAAGGMVVSLTIFWSFKRHILSADKKLEADVAMHRVKDKAAATAVAEDLAPADERAAAMAAVPEWKRIFALIVIFLIVIVFWMIFHQNGSTITLWANDNTEWQVSGIISNAINPLFIIVLALPLAGFWGFLDRRGLEPSTPLKMAFGMILTGVSCLILYLAAVRGGYTKPSLRVLQGSSGEVMVEISPETQKALSITAQPREIQLVQQGETITRTAFAAVTTAPLPAPLARIESIQGDTITVAPVVKMSPWWLVMSIMVISLGELMLSPMGLSLVSQVAPIRMRGLMMGGWFAATAIGNKLTAIGKFWDVWSHAKFFMVLALMAFAVAVVLFVLLRPLKKAMPGV